MVYYLIDYPSYAEGNLEITTNRPHIDVLDCDFNIEEFKSFLEAKDCAMKKAIYKRDMAAFEVRELRALRKKDIN